MDDPSYSSLLPVRSKHLRVTLPGRNILSKDDLHLAMRLQCGGPCACIQLTVEIYSPLLLSDQH